jgi:prephenate dehydratase/chorismate mutase/prephenate dehydratase
MFDEGTIPMSISEVPPSSDAGLRAAYQGEPGAYGEEAVVRYFGADVTPVPKASFAEVFRAVEVGESVSGLIPIENSQAGSITEAYDLLRHTQLSVTGELCLPVNHCLLCLQGQQLSDIQRVLSHPQALAQCDAFLRQLGVEIVAAYDTAGSAKLIHDQELRGVAAVASERAAHIYGLEIIARDIQTIGDNYTRFVALSRQPTPAHVPGEAGKTMLLLVTSHTPGALHRALGVFAARDINLLKLESRPSREKPWEYVFYLDVVGTPDERRLADALTALAREVRHVQVLGSFARSCGD